MKTQFDVNKMVASVTNVDFTKYTNLLKRGMKPSKALIRLGASHREASLLGGLKIAISKEEIDSVYHDATIRSCMTGDSPGAFYEYNGIGVLYSSDFRVLVGNEKGINPRAYGTKGDAVYQLIRHYFDKDVCGPGSVFSLQRREVQEATEGYEESTSLVVHKSTLYFNKSSLNVKADVFTDLRTGSYEVGDAIYHEGNLCGIVAIETYKYTKYITVLKDIYVPILNFVEGIEVPYYFDFDYEVGDSVLSTSRIQCKGVLDVSWLIGVDDLDDLL